MVANLRGMVRFEIELKIADKAEKIQVEQLGSLPGSDGYVRYNLTSNDRNSVVWVDQSYWVKPLIMTEADAWEYLEKPLYPESPLIYGEPPAFLQEELESIRQQIGKHIGAIKS